MVDSDTETQESVMRFFSRTDTGRWKYSGGLTPVELPEGNIIEPGIRYRIKRRQEVPGEEPSEAIFEGFLGSVIRTPGTTENGQVTPDRYRYIFNRTDTPIRKTLTYLSTDGINFRMIGPGADRSYITISFEKVDDTTPGSALKGTALQNLV